MTRSLPRIDWAALGASVGSAVLFTLLLLGPFLVGPTTVCGCSGWPSGSSWACTSTCGGSATASQAPTPTRPGFHRDQPTPWPAPLASALSRRSPAGRPIGRCC
jgi:hypothetical protein